MEYTIALILLLGSIQGFLLAIGLFNKKQNTSANRVLSFSTVIISIALFLAYITFTYPYNEYPHLIKIGAPFAFFFIPGLYLYVKLLTGDSEKISGSFLYYFIPGIIYLAANVPFYLSDAQYKINYFERVYVFQELSKLDIADEVTSNLFNTTFSFMVIYLVIKYRKRIRQEYSDLKGKKLNWLWVLSLTMFVLISTGLIVSTLTVLAIDIARPIYYLTALGSTGCVYMMGYFAMAQPQIFIDELGYHESKEVIDKTSVGEPPDYTALLETITGELIEKKYYTNESLTLHELSKEIGIPAYLISRAINLELNENFHSFINRYRIDRIKQALVDPKLHDQSIISIAYKYGYSSKSTFNHVFKQFTGQTPSFYREKLTSDPGS